MNPKRNPASGYLPLDVDLLLPDITKPFQVYILLGDQYLPYLTAGTLLTEPIRRRLRKTGIRTLYIHDRDKAVLRRYLDQNLKAILQEPSLPLETKSRVIYDSCLSQIENLWEAPSTKLIENGKQVFRLTVDYMLDLSRHGVQHMIRMISYDQSVYTHSVNVGLLGTVLAKEALGGSDPDLHEIGYAMFLHDIGKTKIDYSILSKPGRLSDSEWEQMRRHPELGYQILCEEGHMSPAAAITTLQHHERFDGKGYPGNLPGSEIDPLGRICNLVDSFDALLATRPYKPAFPPFKALQIIKDDVEDPLGWEIFEKFVGLLR